MAPSFHRAQKIFAAGMGMSLLLTGCAGVHPQPFKEYQQALREAWEGADQAVSVNCDWEKANLVAEVARKDKPFSQLEIQRTAGYKLKLAQPKPLFVTLRDVRATLADVNDATIRYVDLLAVLAGNELIERDAFEQTARDVDARFNSIARSLDIQTAGPAIPILSLAYSEISRMLIERQRKEALIRILQENQPRIEAFSAKCIALLDTLEEGLWHAYGKQFQNLDDAFANATGDSSTQTDRRKTLVGRTLKLDDEYLSIVRGLDETRRIYDRLPKGHQELLASVKDRASNLPSIEDILASGKRLQRLYRNMSRNPATEEN